MEDYTTTFPKMLLPSPLLSKMLVLFFKYVWIFPTFNNDGSLCVWGIAVNLAMICLCMTSLYLHINIFWRVANYTWETIRGLVRQMMRKIRKEEPEEENSVETKLYAIYSGEGMRAMSRDEVLEYMEKRRGRGI